jgi:ATP-dependent helicase HrpB
MSAPLTPLPIDAHLAAIVDAVRRHRAAVVTAAPGAGKTTRVPPALATDGPVLVLQPRRVAARAMATRVADERAWTLGEDVGWHVRFDRRFSLRTRVLFATEGVLTARLQQDPLLVGFQTIILDEFHERSLHADVGLALAKQAWLARSDLRLVVMSATIDAARVAAYLHDCPILNVPGRTFPLDVSYAPGQSIDDAVIELSTTTTGAMLCFLPGAPEIRRAEQALATRLSRESIRVLPLHGGLGADAQDAAIRPSSGRRVILATNLAETTVTVPDVTVVIDAGTHKVVRYDASRGVDSLEVERISLDSADQRAGRAGRTQAGVARRLWDAGDRLRAHREPEIRRVDLASTTLDVLAWGGDPYTLDWFEAPARDAIDAAFDLLRRLGGVDAGQRLTPLGRNLRRLSLHPRLGRMLIEARGSIEMARACALLSERSFVPPRHRATPCDLLSAVEDERAMRGHLAKAATQIRDTAREVLGAALVEDTDDATFRRAVFSGYPDRVGRRRAPKTDRFILSSGAGARLSRESGVHDAEFIVASDIGGGAAGVNGEALVRMATAIDREWLSATSSEIRHEYDGTSDRVHATRVEFYDRLPLDERVVVVDPEQAAPLLVEAYLRRGLTHADQQLVRRAAFAGALIDPVELVRRAAASATRLADIDLLAHLLPDVRRQLDRHAPLTVRVPSGRDARLEYRDDGSVVASVKLQEVFGLADSPRIGARAVPVTFELLAPNGRPVQVTRDLKSFWARGYVDVRRELRGRYPKHPWPEDPWTATPTARTKRR